MFSYEYCNFFRNCSLIERLCWLLLFISFSTNLIATFLKIKEEMDYSLKQRFSTQSNIYGGVSGENSKPLKAVRRSHRGCSVRKMFLEISQIHPCQNPFLIKLQVEACNFIKKETLAHLFSC